MKIVNGHHVGGRKRPKQTAATDPHLFRSVLEFATGEIPEVPDCDYFAANPTPQTDVLGNDTLGDCTAAGACHTVESINGAAGSPVVLQKADAIAFYAQSTGYVPGDPSTDQGGDEIAVCQSWQQKGLDGKGTHKILGWLVIPSCANPDDPPTLAAYTKLVRYCLHVFETAYYGVELDDGFMSAVNAGGTFSPWKPAADWDTGTPDPQDGHCVIGGGTTGGSSAAADPHKDGVKINTWGIPVLFSYYGTAKFTAEANGGNLFIPVSQEIMNRAQAKSPNGFDWPAIVAAFDAMGGTGIPTPLASSPPPAPTSSPGEITLTDSSPPSAPVGPAATS